MPPKGPETANTTVNSEAEKTKLTNSADNNGETQDVIKDTTGELSDVKDNIVKTKTAALSAKVDAPLLAAADANTDRPTRKELREEGKELRKERIDDKKLTRLIDRLNKKIEKTSKSKQELNKTTFKNDLLMMNLEDLRNFNDYLMDVRNKKIDPATKKFQPQNMESFLSLLVQFPYAKGYIDFGPAKSTDIKLGGSSNNGTEIYIQTDKNNRGKTNSMVKDINTSDNATLGEAYTEHGVRGLIKKSFDYFPNMTENQKDGRTNALFLGGMGFAIFKLGKRFFTGAKDKDGKQIGPGFLGRVAIAGGVFLGSNMLTGKSPIELIDKALNGGMSREYLKGERGKGADGAAKLDKQKYVYPLTVSTIFGKTKISDLGNALDDNFKIKDYEALLQKAKADGNQEVVDMLDRVGKGDKDNQIKQGLEQLGIKKDNLTTFGDKTVDDLKKIYDANLSKALTYKTDNGLMQDVNDKEKIKKYNDLMSNGKEITDDDLKKLVEEGVLYEQFELKKDSNREALKNKVDKLEDGKSLKIKIGDDNAELSKINGISEIELKSKNGNITKINLDLPSIVGLGDGEDRPFVDKNDNPDIYSTILYAHKFNGLKNRYKNRKVAAGDTPFKFENGKIYFNESKTGTTEINKVEVMDDGIILGLMTDFPDVFEGQQQQIVNYLNKEIILQNQALEDVVKTFNSNNIQMELVGGDLKSHGETTKIDITNKKIIGLDDTNGTGPNRQFKNYSELVGGANLINFFKKFLRNRPAQSAENPIYIGGVDGNIAFNDRTIFQEMRSYANRGANGFGDSDLVQSGELFFRKANSLKNVSPTLYDHRKEFVSRLNNNGTFQEKISESTERTKLKEKVNNLQNTDKLKVKIGDDSIELQKNGSLSSVNVISSEGKITTVNLEKVTIKGLGSTNGTTVIDRRFTDSEGHNNYLELLVTANALNNIKNKYEDKIYAAGLSAPGKNPGFKYESKDNKIYFNESKEGGGILQDAAMDDGMFFSDFPESFKGQENQIVTYLNNEVVISQESPDRVMEYFRSRGIDAKLVSSGTTTEVESYGYKTKIDLKNKKLDNLGRQFTNHLELIGAANLVNMISKILKDKSALSKDGIYIQFNGDAAFNDKTILEELKTYFNEGLHGYGDTDIREKNTLKQISPTLHANRREFVNYLNNKGIYNAETRQLQEKKARIEKAVNNGMRTPITFADGGMKYDEGSKELTITAIDENSISNDQMVNNNLVNIENFVSRYDILQSEDVKKIILPNINLEPGKTVSVKYLKKLLDLDEKKIQLGPDFLANREMIRYVIDKKYSEGRFKIEENTNLDMNGVVILKYIYENGYDFDRLFDGEDDSRLDFTTRVMQLLSKGETIIDHDHKKELLKIKGAPITLKPNHDPIMEWRRVARGENVNYAYDIRRGIRNRFFTARNDNILEKIAKYYNEDYPNIADTNP